MIPKIIHYCWFGGNLLPKSAKKYIASWKKHMPDYEIKEWNESNFDINMIPYIREAYEARKFAYVSDFARFWIIFNYGGLYFDTDVEIVKSLQAIVDRGAFMGFERSERKIDNCCPVAVGLGMGAEKGDSICGEIIEVYKQSHFNVINQESGDLVNVVDITTRIMAKHGLRPGSEIQEVENYTIYPSDYFCPFDPQIQRMFKTKNTYTIHWYDGSWHGWQVKFKKKIKRLIPARLSRWIMNKKRNEKL